MTQLGWSPPGWLLPGWSVFARLGRRPIAPWLLALVTLALVLPGLVDLPAVDRDEARFAQASRQMLESGDLIDIRFLDEARHRKPVGIYWVQAATVALTGEGRDNPIWPYRLPSVLGVLAGVLATWALGARLIGPGVGFVAALLLAASVLVGVEARQAKTDGMLFGIIAVMQAQLLHIHAAAAEGRRATALAAAGFWAALAWGVLLKGPIAPMIAALTVGGLILVERRAGWLEQLRPVSGAALALVLILPWFVAIMIRTEGAFLTGALSDLAPKLTSGHERSGAPPGVHALALLVSFWPFSLLLALAVPLAWRTRATPVTRALLCWLLPGWLVFELVPAKLLHYTLPLWPPLALLTALSLKEPMAEAAGRAARWGRRLWFGLWCLAGLALTGAALALPFLLLEEIGAALAWSAFAAAAFLAAVSLGGIQWLARQPERMVLPLVACSFLAQACLHGGLFPALTPLWPARELAQALARAGIAGPVAVAGHGEPSLAVWLGSGTRIGGGAAAGAALAEGRVVAAAVSPAEEAAFRAAAGPDIAPIATIDAVVYPKGGRPLTLTLWRRVP